MNAKELLAKMFQTNLMDGGQLHQLMNMAQNNSDGELAHLRDDEFDSTKSGSDNQEGASGEDQNPRPKKKRYHRHTQHQIQEMEAYVGPSFC